METHRQAGSDRLDFAGPKRHLLFLAPHHQRCRTKSRLDRIRAPDDAGLLVDNLVGPGFRLEREAETVAGQNSFGGITGNHRRQRQPTCQRYDSSKHTSALPPIPTEAHDKNQTARFTSTAGADTGISRTKRTSTMTYVWIHVNYPSGQRTQADESKPCRPSLGSAPRCRPGPKPRPVGWLVFLAGVVPHATLARNIMGRKVKADGGSS